MACVMRITYLSFCPTVFSSPVEKERAQVFLGGWLVVFACCALCLLPVFFLFLFLSVASSITHLFALRFPYKEGVEGAFFFFCCNILVIPCAASCCRPL